MQNSVNPSFLYYQGRRYRIARIHKRNGKMCTHYAVSRNLLKPRTVNILDENGAVLYTDTFRMDPDAHAMDILWRADSRCH